MMGVVSPHRRGIASGARVLVQNTGAVLSIAFVLAVVTSSVPKTVLFAVFSGLAHGISNEQLTPFVTNMHTALWCLTGVSLLGAVVRSPGPRTSRTPSMRPRTSTSRRNTVLTPPTGGPGSRRGAMSATPVSAGEPVNTSRPIRIGELAELTGTTPRTIRYYEEIGLLGSAEAREQGKHRCYTVADVERLKEIVRLRDLLGLSLEQLSRWSRRGGARGDPPRVP